MRRRAIAGAAVAGLAFVLARPQLVAGPADAPQVATTPAPQPESATHWAYRPVKRPELPAVQHQQWVRTPIDAFVLARLEEKGIKPSPDADRATFIRRATLDVWGLIPTPEEVAAFVADRSPDAYEKLVDRLLASPRYAERQARRWLDLARYSGQHRLRRRSHAPEHVALSRLRDRCVRQGQAVRPVRQGADRRRRTGARQSGVTGCHRVSGRLSGQLQLARHGRAQVSDHHRHDRHGRRGVPGPDRRLRADATTTSSTGSPRRNTSSSSPSLRTRPKSTTSRPRSRRRRSSIKRRRPSGRRRPRTFARKREALLNVVRTETDQVPEGAVSDGYARRRSSSRRSSGRRSIAGSITAGRT